MKQTLVVECHSKKDAENILSARLDRICDANGDIYPAFTTHYGARSMTLTFNDPLYEDVYCEWPDPLDDDGIDTEDDDLERYLWRFDDRPNGKGERMNPTRTILIHLNVEIRDDDDRTPEQIATLVSGNFLRERLGAIEVSIPLAEEV